MCEVVDISEVRKQQVGRMLERSQCVPDHKCGGCGLLRRMCICQSMREVLMPCRRTVRHKLTVLIHPREVQRASSTHRILKHAGSDARVLRWLDDGASSLSAVYDSIASSASQVPVLLYPGPHALSPTDLLASLSQEGRKAGVHLIVIDGTWNEARQITKGLNGLHDIRMMSLGPADILCRHSLLQPLRRQPHADRISTCEAVAAALEALYAAEHPDRPECRLVPLPPSTQPPLFHEELLPASPYTAARRLRLALAFHVDALCKQNGMVEQGWREGCGSEARGVRGGGYRTWTVPDTGPSLGKLPGYVLEIIAVMAYGREKVARAGYRTRTGKGADVREWAGQQRGSAGGSASTASAVPTAGTEEAKVNPRDPWVRRKFPSPTLYTSVPLAGCCKELLEWCAGGRRARRCHVPTLGGPRAEQREGEEEEEEEQGGQRDGQEQCT